MPTYLRLSRRGFPTIFRVNKPGTKFNTRIRFQHALHCLTLSETAEESFARALAARREIHAGRWQTLKRATQLRGNVTVQQLLDRYATGIVTTADAVCNRRSLIRLRRLSADRQVTAALPQNQPRSFWDQRKRSNHTDG